MVPYVYARAFYFWVNWKSFLPRITYPWWLLGYGYYCLIVVLMLFIALYVCIVLVYSYYMFGALLVFRGYMLFCWVRFVACHVFICPLSFANAGVLKLF